MTEYIPVAEYTWLCDKDRAKLANITDLFVGGNMPDTLDEEAPCNFMYDNKLFCGGWTCITGEE